MRSGVPISVRRVAQLVLTKDARDQKFEIERFFQARFNREAQPADDKAWLRARHELLWLRDWGVKDGNEGGVYRQISNDFIEISFLKQLLSKNRVNLAQKIYQTPHERPLSDEILRETIITEATNAFDNATNANKTRGGLKRCDEILNTFSKTIEDSHEAEQLKRLVELTHEIGQYRLVFKQGEPFKPVMMRVHHDPISILGKVLEQNPGSYTKLNNFIDFGRDMVAAGIVPGLDSSGIANGEKDAVYTKAQQKLVERRVISMCIAAALAEDDFETAYSYVITRLVRIGNPAQQRESINDRDVAFSETRTTALDDWSWLVALAAGKYRRISRPVRSSHNGISTADTEIRHLEQRMECLSHAIRLAPNAALSEIINVFRRCEEELESSLKQEDEQEAAWDARGDGNSMPGGFASTTKSTPSKLRAEEAPMSLFDLSKGALTRAQSGFVSLSQRDGRNVGAPRERKRDQLKNAAVGTVAAGVGWLIGATPVNDK